MILCYESYLQFSQIEQLFDHEDNEDVCSIFQSGFGQDVPTLSQILISLSHDLYDVDFAAFLRRLISSCIFTIDNFDDGVCSTLNFLNHLFEVDLSQE